MTAAVLTPITNDLAAAVGPRLYRKQVLPIGSIDYKGRRLDFTRDYLASLVTAFKDRAYDSVKFLLAPDDNRHTLDPERARGTVKGFELTGDGLDMLLEPTDEGAKVLDEHPDLGVSARIVEGLARADGKTFPRAIQHVLGTFDPRVTGMRPWEAVSLSTEDQALTVVDLSAESFTEPEATVPEITDEQKALLDKLSAVPQDKLDAILAGPAAPEPGEPTDAEVQAALEALEADANKQPEDAALSAEAQAKLDLANSRAENAEATARDSARRVALAEWTAEAQKLLLAGVSKADIDLAGPWCGGDVPDGFIDLANDDTTVEQVKAAAADTIRRLLANHKGDVDLSVIGETPDTDEAAAKKRREDASAYAKHAGITG